MNFVWQKLGHTLWNKKIKDSNRDNFDISLVKTTRRSSSMLYIISIDNERLYRFIVDHGWTLSSVITFHNDHNNNLLLHFRTLLQTDVSLALIWSSDCFDQLNCIIDWLIDILSKLCRLVWNRLQIFSLTAFLV